MTEVQRTEKRPDELVADNVAEYALVLPPQLSPELFTRVSVGLLRRNPSLMAAAAANPPAMLNALLDCAQLGLEPGTKDVAFLPFQVKRKGPDGRERKVWEIECVPQWQGLVKRMHNSGRVRSVHADVVYAGEPFDLVGDGARPRHVIGDVFDRGLNSDGSDSKLVGAYAYAVLDDGTPSGTVSRVALVGPREVARAKAKSRGSGSAHSPWNTSTAEMWRKTALRRLEDWVPSSSVDQVWQARMAAAGHPAAAAAPASAAVEPAASIPALPPPPATLPTPDPQSDTPVDTAEFVDTVTGEIVDAEIMEPGDE